MPLSEDEMQLAGATITQRGAHNVCPACTRQGTLGVAPAVARLPAPNHPLIPDTQTIPCAVLICNNCGFVRMHALLPLGLPNLGVGGLR
jgi:hypothetical protein